MYNIISFSIAYGRKCRICRRDAYIRVYIYIYIYIFFFYRSVSRIKKKKNEISRVVNKRSRTLFTVLILIKRVLKNILDLSIVFPVSVVRTQAEGEKKKLTSVNKRFSFIFEQ